MKKILLVDDDTSLRQLYKLELANRGYSVVEASDGEEGLTKAQTEKPDLVLLDIMMPKLDGVAMLGKMKTDSVMKQVTVVMLTNFGQENLVKQAFGLGATDYLLKYKVTPAEMADKVDKLLSGAS